MTEEADPSVELARRVEEVNAAYERNPALRAVVVAIPGIGSSLDMVLASEGQRIFRERIFKLMEAMKKDMKERMETVEDSIVDKEYLESEEFFDLVMSALDATIKTRDETKRRMFARILTESTVLSNSEGHSPEEYLDIVAALTPRELIVARALHTDWLRSGEEYNRLQRLEGGDKVGDDWRAWQDRVRNEVSIDAMDLQLILGRLHSSGVVTEHFGTVSSTPSLDRLPVYYASPSFQKLMRFLERRGQALED